MTGASKNRSAASWIVVIVAVAAVIGLLLFARGPENQDRSGAVAPSAVIAPSA